jgi:hypothetical protein
MVTVVRQCPSCGELLAPQIFDRPAQRETMLRELATMVTRYRAHNDQVAAKLLSSRGDR